MSPSRPSVDRLRREEGGATLCFGPLLLWLLLVLSVVVIDIGAYFVAAARAQSAADSAALAAVSADATLRTVHTDPEREARGVLRRSDTRLESCDCRAGTGRASVRVSVEVGGLVVPRVQGMTRVTAEAEARLAPPDPDDPRRSHLPPTPDLGSSHGSPGTAG